MSSISLDDTHLSLIVGKGLGKVSVILQCSNNLFRICC
jgi:hypothetical protein